MGKHYSIIHGAFVHRLFGPGVDILIGYGQEQEAQRWMAALDGAFEAGADVWVVNKIGPQTLAYPPAVDAAHAHLITCAPSLPPAFLERSSCCGAKVLPVTTVWNTMESYLLCMKCIKRCGTMRYVAQHAAPSPGGGTHGAEPDKTK